MLNLAGFVSEGLFSDNKIKIDPPHHPELIDSVNIVRDLLSDERFRNMANGIPDDYMRALTMIKDPVIRKYINYILETCFAQMIPLKSVIKSIADELHQKDELSGDEVSSIFDLYKQSSLKRIRL